MNYPWDPRSAGDMKDIWTCFQSLRDLAIEAQLSDSAQICSCTVNGHVMKTSQAPIAPYPDACVKIVDVRLRDLEHNDVA